YIFIYTFISTNEFFKKQLKYFKPFKELKGHFDQINSIKISSDGTKIVSSSNDKTIKIWDIASNRHNNNVTRIMFSKDGKIIISAKIWDVISEQEIQTLKGKLLGKNDYYIIEIWDIQSSKIIKNFNMQMMYRKQNIILMVVLLFQFQQIETIQIWDVESGILLKECLNL
ncbi:WD-40 repeat protein, partial [Reticulomyxa filosa]